MVRPSFLVKEDLNMHINLGRNPEEKGGSNSEGEKMDEARYYGGDRK